MKIGIIGGGVVGRATARCFMEQHEVFVWDTDPNRRTHERSHINVCDLIFVCLPSPQKGDSFSCDTSIIEDFFKDAQRIGMHDRNYVLRSTVPVGFTRRMTEKYGLKNLVHSPEFLTARCSITDAQRPARNIVGLPGGGFDSPLLRKLYADRFPGVPCLIMTSDESELVKLGLNSFFATKVAFFNELRTFADKFDMDWGTVIAGILSDGRVAHSHTQVPGPDGKRGFGGGCLPKDLANLIDCMERMGASPTVTRAAHYRNQLDRGEA